MSIGERIKDVRDNRLYLTQKELAAHLGVDQVNVSRWERGVAEPRIRYVRDIAELAGLPVGWFFNGDEEEAA